MRRLITKEARMAVRDYEIERMREKAGFVLDTHGSLLIATYQENMDSPKPRYILKVWRGTSATTFINFYYPTYEGRERKILELKAMEDRHITYRKEQKKANQGQSSAHALCAKSIKEELQKAWPTVKFSVKSECYSGGTSVRATWELGPTERQVEKITSRYQHGSFDGMTDSYTYCKTETNGSAKYVFADRKNPLVEQMARDYAKAAGVEYVDHNSQYCGEYISTLVHRLLCQFDLTKSGYQGIRYVEGVKGGFREDFYEFIGGKRIPRY